MSVMTMNDQKPFNRWMPSSISDYSSSGHLGLHAPSIEKLGVPAEAEYGESAPWIDALESKVSIMESKIKSKIDSVFGDFKVVLDTIENAKENMVH